MRGGGGLYHLGGGGQAGAAEGSGAVSGVNCAAGSAPPWARLQAALYRAHAACTEPAGRTRLVRPSPLASVQVALAGPATAPRRAVALQRASCWRCRYRVARGDGRVSAVFGCCSGAVFYVS